MSREAENKLFSDDTSNALFSSPIVKVEPAAAPVNLIRRVISDLENPTALGAKQCRRSDLMHGSRDEPLTSKDSSLTLGRA